MADQLPTKNYYNNLGGVNQKASKYEMSTAQFLDLRNVDFDVPKALQKRPGQTYAINSANGTSGPITSLHEFIALNGNSYVALSSDTALWMINPAANNYSLLASGWNNGQPVDFLTFTNKMFAANGQNWSFVDGNTNPPAALPVGLPAIFGRGAYNAGGNTFSNDFWFTPTSLDLGNSMGGATWMTVWGATHIPGVGGNSFIARGIYVAASYVRQDGYIGPADFMASAKNLVRNMIATGAGAWEAEPGYSNTIMAGFTIPPGRGISAIAIWVATDTVTQASAREDIPGIGSVPCGDLGWAETFAGPRRLMSLTLKPGADLSRFRLYTLVPGASLFLANDGAIGHTFYASTFITLNGFTAINGVAPPSLGFSAMSFDFFSTYTPKYIEVNQNIMFAGGFSVAPSSVFFSEIGKPEIYLPESTFEVRTNDGDRLYGLFAFNNQILALKKRSFSKLIGNSADNFELVSCSNDFGLLSQRTILSKDQVLYWLDQKGILMYNGANWQIVSDPVEGIFRRMNISAAEEKACGVHHLERNQLWWGIPVDGSTVNNMTVVYDYLVNAWTFFDGFNPASFSYIKGALTKPTVWRGDYSGLVHYFGQSFYSDSGQGITCLVFTHFDTDAQNKTTLWRRLFLDVAQASGITGQIKGQMYHNYDQSTIQATFAAYQNDFQTRVEFGVQGKSVAAQFSHYSASMPLLINGYGWANRDLRNV